MKIGITLKNGAYTPEAYAYESYLVKKGLQVELDYNLDPNNDVNIYFMGVRPFFSKSSGRATEIHEYQSLSVPPFSAIKDSVKRVINRKPSGRIFLNNIVRDGLGFSDGIKYINRDMGVDENFYNINPNPNPEFDIVYSGSIVGRDGLIETITKLSINYRIMLIGLVSQDLINYFKNNKNVSLVGKVERHELPELYSKCRFGLNFTPDVYPFNIQTSTKTLEYLASGLSLISNKYQWIVSFKDEHNIPILWLDDFQNLNCNIQYDRDLLKDFKWDNILENSNFLNFILDLG